MQIVQLPFDRITEIKSLWESLRDVHVADANNFGEVYKKKTFEKRIEKFNKLDKKDVLILTVLEGEVIKGYLISSVDRNTKIGEIDSLYVVDECRGLGYGKALCESSLKWQKEQACERFIVGVAEGHESVFDFYNTLGFKKRLTYLEMIES